ncbi:MAG TPA: Tol-Pal system beta propeller repeat protein TolB [Candidatus Acidoferrales bacterium]|nr:Tol-Pal system beta propeller repeat protein TolB [Candidatus Acidoferrales bacterium]
MKSRKVAVLTAFLLLTLALPTFGQDWIRTGTGLGVEKVRLAAADFSLNADAQNAGLRTTFNDVLWNDLTQAGIFDMVSKSFYPLGNFGMPTDIQLNAWSSPPPNAAMLAFGNMAVSGGNLIVQGWLFDVRNAQNPQVLAKQYHETATDENARVIAHRFANEIIYRLGGGIQGIAETKIYFASTRTGQREIWSMDYDGANEHQITKLGSISLQPRISPDNSRLAFASFLKGGPDILMYSLDLGRLVNFPRFGGTTITPAWTSDGMRIAFSSSRAGNPNIFVCDANGGNLKRLTSGNGPDVSPVWNPKTNGQIAFVSGRTGLPQIYVMDADGSNLQRLTNEGYAVSPSWSPNGQFLAFAWIRHYGPGAPGAQDIYIMDIASRRWVQLTHDGGRNDVPSWSPDGRHIVFQSSRSGREEIWTMLADGSQQRQLTNNGTNSQPNWSWK